MLKNITQNRYANMYLNAADKHGLKYTILDEEIGLVEIYNDHKTIQISSNVLDLNSQLSGFLASNKMKTSKLLQKSFIPVPEFKTFSEVEKAKKYALELAQNKQKFVTKPLSGSLSVGITVDPRSKNEVLDAIDESFNQSSEIIIEKYIKGKHYRVTMVDDEIIAVTERRAAHVVADGKKTIPELIEDKNVMRVKQDLPLIVLRNKDKNYLLTKNIDFDTVYPKGKKIILQLGCDLDIGGERERIDINKIPKVNKDLFIQAMQTLYLRFGGIDYISPDIYTPYIELESAINEINGAPDQDVHLKDSDIDDNYSSEKILKKIFNIENTEAVSFTMSSTLPVKDLIPSV